MLIRHLRPMDAGSTLITISHNDCAGLFVATRGNGVYHTFLLRCQRLLAGGLNDRVCDLDARLRVVGKDLESI
jgi:hypothetical protein